MALSEPGTEER